MGLLWYQITGFSNWVGTSNKDSNPPIQAATVDQMTTNYLKQLITTIAQSWLYIYIYIYMFVSVCVCVCVSTYSKHIAHFPCELFCKFITSRLNRWNNAQNTGTEADLNRYQIYFYFGKTSKYQKANYSLSTELGDRGMQYFEEKKLNNAQLVNDMVWFIPRRFQIFSLLN